MCDLSGAEVKCGMLDASSSSGYKEDEASNMYHMCSGMAEV